MSRISFRSPVVAGIALAFCALFAGAPHAAHAAVPVEATAGVAHVTAADRVAASTIRSSATHLLPARTATGLIAQAKIRAGAKINVTPASQFAYPADLEYFGGSTLKTVVQNDIYVNEPNGATWGNPATFQSNLSLSSFIHLTDQYVGSTAANRYPVGPSLSLTLPIYTALYDQDVLALVHAAALKLGSTGLGHINHLFFPPGVDVCFNGGGCYSPDNTSTFAFCAYHSSVTFNDIGLVLYSVEPYQPVPGCGVDFSGNVPVNSQLIDGTATVLSHELIETITDPNPYGPGDPRSGYVVGQDLDLYGYEIGDVCQMLTVPTNLFNTQKYTIQLEYSNHYHGCANGP